MPQIVWTAQPDDGWSYNARWHEYTGNVRPPGTGRWLDAAHPEDAESARQRWESAIDNGTAFEVQCRLRRADSIGMTSLLMDTPLTAEQRDHPVVGRGVVED